MALRGRLGAVVRSAFLTVCLALAGCGGESGADQRRDAPDHDPTPADFRAVQRVLDDRAAAVLAGDEDAFRATLDDRDDEFVEAQMTVFDNLVALPVLTISYTTEPSGMPPADVEGEDPVVRPLATERVRLEGPDTRPVANDVEMTFVRRDGTWLLAAEREPELRPTEVRSRAWSGGPLAVEVRGPLVVVTDRDRSTDVGQLADRVERHLSSLAGALGARPDRNLLVDASSSGASYRMNHAESGRAGAVTFAVGDGRRLAGHRVKIDPGIADAVARGRHQLLLRHELTHFLLRRQDPWIPTWLSEGVAEHAGAIRFRGEFTLAREVKAEVMAARMEIPESGAFATFPARNYLVSATLVDLLVEARGLGRVMELLRAYPRTGFPDDATARLLRRLFGFTERELAERAWQRIRSTPAA